MIYENDVDLNFTKRFSDTGLCKFPSIRKYG